MVYQRLRNSTYAQYSRNMRGMGRQAYFSVPMRRTANFSPLMDVMNQAATYGGDMMQHAGQYGADAMQAGRQMLGGMGDVAGQAAGRIGELGGQAMQGVQHGVQQAGDYISNLPNVAKAAMGAGGIAGAAGVGARAMNKMGPNPGAALAGVAEVGDDLADAAVAGGSGLAQGLRNAASGARAKLQGIDPRMAAGGLAGAGVLGAGAYGANQYMNREQQ